MNKSIIAIIASVLAILLAIGMVVRMNMQKKHFDKIVQEALKTSEGYDQIFIDMVNRLEVELATRASFGYTGGKDPMTGTKRQVVSQLPTLGPGLAASSGAPKEPGDPVKLTAIIADAAGRKITAVVMDGERSYSVEPGDVVANRKITKITNEGIYMETDSLYYFYDIYGKKGTRLKESVLPQVP
jgi:hypothetical protein